METSDRSLRAARLRRQKSGYTLVEVLVASGILAMGIAAACSMSLAMGAQEEMNHRIALALNHQENAARLFQLGVGPSILPADPNTTLDLTTSTSAVAGAGSLVTAVIKATITTHGTDTRESFLTAHRSSIP